jgi:protein-disulfide isomerase
MHDKLFENQHALDAASLEKYATEVGVDAAKWTACFSASKYNAQILADQDLGSKVTARGTPNVFINGRKLTGAKPIEEFKTLIDEEMRRAEAAIAKGVTADKVYDELIKDGKVFEPLEEKVNAFQLDGSPTKGNKDAKIQIVEFSDFQCPFCSRVSAPLKDLEAKYGDQLSVTFKHFPLSFHKDAMPAALASMCAHEQGKFWEYHDRLFANQKALQAENLKTYATNVGLDVAKWEACVQANKHQSLVDADMAEAREAQVRGTPTVFINGRKFNSNTGYNVDAFAAVIDSYVLAGRPQPHQPVAISRKSSIALEITDLAVVTASSTLPADLGMTFKPGNLIDRDLGTSWQPSAKRSNGVGQWFSLRFRVRHDINEIELANGFQSTYDGQDLFWTNARLKEVEIQLGARTLRAKFDEGERGYAKIPIDPAASTDKITVRVLSIYPGTRWPDLAISEVRVHAYAIPQ